MEQVQMFFRNYAVVLMMLSVLSIGSLTSAQVSQTKSKTGNVQSLSLDTLVRVGKDHFENGRHQQALRFFSTAIKKDPEYADLYIYRGETYEAMNSPGQAIKDFGKFIELRPRDPKGYLRRADVNNFNQNFESAIEDYNKAVKISPSKIEPYLGRGLAYAGLERFQDAVKDYQWVLKNDPAHKEATINMGIAYMLSGKNLEAVAYFERALKLGIDAQSKSKIEKWTQEILNKADHIPAMKSDPIKGPR
jgi:tetratricopeptide (TPR) repeat protein